MQLALLKSSKAKSDLTVAIQEFRDGRVANAKKDEAEANAFAKKASDAYNHGLQLITKASQEAPKMQLVDETDLEQDAKNALDAVSNKEELAKYAAHEAHDSGFAMPVEQREAPVDSQNALAHFLS